MHNGGGGGFTYQHVIQGTLKSPRDGKMSSVPRQGVEHVTGPGTTYFTTYAATYCTMLRTRSQVGTKLVPSWVQVGSKLGPSWTMPSWYQVGTKLGSSWVQVGICQVGSKLGWGDVTDQDPSWYQIGTKLGPSLGICWHWWCVQVHGPSHRAM